MPLPFRPPMVKQINKEHASLYTKFSYNNKLYNLSASKVANFIANNF